MARVPTIAEEDAKRPNRERDCLVGERTRIVNRIKSTLARLGIRNFKPTLRQATERLTCPTSLHASVLRRTTPCRWQYAAAATPAPEPHCAMTGWWSTCRA